MYLILSDLKKTMPDSNEKINELMDLFSTKFNAKITLCIVDNENFIDKQIITDKILLFENFEELHTYISKRIEISNK